MEPQTGAKGIQSPEVGAEKKTQASSSLQVKTAVRSLPGAQYKLHMDFLSDALSAKRKIRVLNIMDDCTRESLGVYADFSIPGEKVVEVLRHIVAERGKPKQIRVDNGPEFLSKAFTSWCLKNEIVIKYIQPGKPMQNGYIERLNRTFREDVLDAYEFEILEQLRILCDEWQFSYNHYHPHQALKGKTPAMTANNYQKQNEISLN